MTMRSDSSCVHVCVSGSVDSSTPWYLLVERGVTRGSPLRVRAGAGPFGARVACGESPWPDSPTLTPSLRAHRSQTWQGRWCLRAGSAALNPLRHSLSLILSLRPAEGSARSAVHHSKSRRRHACPPGRAGQHVSGGCRGSAGRLGALGKAGRRASSKARSSEISSWKNSCAREPSARKPAASASSSDASGSTKQESSSAAESVALPCAGWQPGNTHGRTPPHPEPHAQHARARCAPVA